MQVTPRHLRFLLLVVFGCAALIAHTGSLSRQIVYAEDDAKTPVLTISALKERFVTDKNSFGLLLEPTRNVTSDSHFFYRTPQGLQVLKKLGVTSLLYVADRNNWRALYDDISGTPQPYPSGITPVEGVRIAKAIGAEFVPILNVTVQCKHVAGTEYVSANLKCQHAKAKSSAKLVKLLKKETAKQGVMFKHVIMGLEPYAGCAYWAFPSGVNCTMRKPVGQHRIGLPAEEYVKRIHEWGVAIHKVMPSLLIGAHLQSNTYYCIKSCSREWDQVVLQDAAPDIDFVIGHDYFRITDLTVPGPGQAQKYSYYQNQVEQNLQKLERTGMPVQLRKEIEMWAPGNKKKMPLWYSEFNAAYPDELFSHDAGEIRRTMYAGLSVGELYLDLLSPPVIKNKASAGASRAILHHLFAETSFIAAYQPHQATNQTMIYTPSYHILTALKAFAGKEWLAVTAQNVPKNATKRPSIIGYAARAGKKLTIALFNHEQTAAQTVDINLTDLRAKKVQVTQIGDTASSLSSQNNLATPNLIVPHTTKLDKSQIKQSGLAKVPLAPHSLTILQVKLK